MHPYYLVSFIVIFFTIQIGYFITWPIVGYDTDLWYHLSGGRYLWQNGVIARDAFFSYIVPEKSWYNYYWMFQAIIYKIFQGMGYHGLIALRCVLYFLTALFICLFLVHRRNNRTELLFGLSLFIGCTIAIIHRELLVRPHLFSYLFIVIFLFILECKRDKIWLLPLLGILWSNIHGIEYPVMFLIVFAYLAEIYWRQFRKMPIGGVVGKKEKWLLISVFYTIFITPGVIELVQTPFSVSFENAAYQYLYVAELFPIPFRNFFVFAPVTTKGLISSLQNAIVLLTVASFLMGLWKRNLKISHAILFFGSLLLLAKHARFTYEFTLLSLPLLSHGTSLLAGKIQFPRRFVDLALPLVVVLFPFLIFSSTFGNRPTYPFSQSNLPTGVARFLNRHADGGRILNEPNTGGYLPWALNPKFKIYMDMQMTIFSDTDFATVQNVFADANVFKAFINSHEPSFISVSLNRSYFKKVVANDPRFVPVFFDDTELLYVNKSHFRDLAAKFELKAIDPFHFKEIKYADLKPDMLSRIFDEAVKMREQDPKNCSANHILSSISLVRRQYDQALIYADEIVRYFPELSYGHALKAEALFGKERYVEAAHLHQGVLDEAQMTPPDKEYLNLYATYVKLKEYKKAYKLLSKYVNPFSLNADYKEIYQLGISAASVGKIREAVTFLKIAKMKAPPEDKEYVNKINESLLMLSSNPK